MDKENLPDLSLEKDILNKLDLTEDEKLGAEKFLEAITSLKGWDDDLDDIPTDGNFLPQDHNKQINEPQLNALINRVSEFMSSYVLVGYDMGGNRVSVFSFATQLEADASIVNMSTALQECKELINDGELNN